MRDDARYELLKVCTRRPTSRGCTNLFRFEELQDKVQPAGDGAHDIPYEDLDAAGATAGQPYRRLIEHARTLYRATTSRRLAAARELEPLALPGESYKLAFTPGLLVARSISANRRRAAAESCCRTRLRCCGSQGADHGGYVDLDGDGHWWIPSGRSSTIRDPTQRRRRSLTRPDSISSCRAASRTRSATTATVATTPTTLLVHGDPRTRSATRVSGRRTTIAFCSRRWSPIQRQPLGGRLRRARAGGRHGGHGQEHGELGRLARQASIADLTPAQIDAFFNATDPHDPAHALLEDATTRIVYDLDRFADAGDPEPTVAARFAATLARETHVSDLAPAQRLKIQLSFTYSDGFGREIQKKIQAEPGPREPKTAAPVVNPRWVGSGWTIFNNKGKPVRQYEPFFSQLAKAPSVRVRRTRSASARSCSTTRSSASSPRSIPTTPTRRSSSTRGSRQPGMSTTPSRSNPNSIWTPTWGFFSGYLERPTICPLGTPSALAGAKGADGEKSPRKQAAKHASTPTVAYFDTLGRPFLTIAHNARTTATVRDRTSISTSKATDAPVTDALGRNVMRVRLRHAGQRRSIRPAWRRASVGC